MLSVAYLIIIFFLSYLIWLSSDSFERASSYLGRNMSPGVRGATINAIGSSMPELFTAIFFLAIAGNAEGFSGGFGTMIGSALFNLLIVPSAVFLTLLYYSPNHSSLSTTLSRQSLWRDTLFLILAQGLLFLVIRPQMHWWHGMILIGFYGLYLFTLLKYRGKEKRTNDDVVDEDISTNKPEGKPSRQYHLDIYNMVVGSGQVNTRKAWCVLLLSMVCMGGACLALVHLCELLGVLWNLPLLVIALIIAASATSLPDLFISVRDAKKGNTTDALSNALGSNIFDICVALGLPILLFVLVNDEGILHAFVKKQDWAFSILLRWVLIGLTILASLLLILPRVSLKTKSIGLFSLYILFLLFVVSYGAEFDILLDIMDKLLATDVSQRLL